MQKMDVVFKDGKVQKGYRIKIPKAIVDTLNIKEGQKVIIRFSENGKLIVEVKK